jgi:3-hydroxybutyryl-CoA dehydratase
MTIMRARWAIPAASRMGFSASLCAMGWRWSFTGPILVGDRIAARITVLSKRPTRNPARGIVTLGFDLVNQKNEVVQKGENDLMVHTSKVDEAP